MSSVNDNTGDDIGFQKYVANRLSPLGEFDFEVLRSLISGYTYKEYFDPKQFSEAKYASVFGHLQTLVNEPDPALFLEAAYQRGLVLGAPTPAATIIWPLFKNLEEEKVEDGLYLWSVHEVYERLKQELADFVAQDEASQQNILHDSQEGKALMMFSLELAALNAENKEKIPSLESLGENGLALFLKKRMADHLNVQLATEAGAKAKECLQESFNLAI